jgi:hypothetical protein
MIRFHYYVLHKVQVGKGVVTEAGRVLERTSPISSVEDVQGICAALAVHHKAQKDHVMVCSWQYLRWSFAIKESLVAWWWVACKLVTGK